MSSKTWRRFATSAAVISVAIASAVVGGASTSQAATGFIVDLQPQVGTPNNTVSVVSRGAKIGYHLFIQNSGDSTTQHVTIVVRGVTATFLDADNPLCGPGPTTDKMVCTPTGATLAPGDTFNVNFRFVAPAAGDSVSTTAAITVSAQTVG